LFAIKGRGAGARLAEAVMRGRGDITRDRFRDRQAAITRGEFFVYALSSLVKEVIEKAGKVFSKLF